MALWSIILVMHLFSFEEAQELIDEYEYYHLSTAVNRQIFQFRAHDQSHSRSTEIYAELEKISKELIEYNYEYHSN
ncbi:unnamed protein product [Rotaria sordida]|uniref:Uncharacterized protein n=1 Tax=Rotaria sordida TaxID=392033 RepID=A0A814ZG69_9BILA|nr:unnamed protein product [Rotaria sordida]